MLKCKLWLITGMLLGSAAITYSQTARKPNIMLIIADDLSYSDIQPYGNEQVKTPNLQRLANQGVCLDNMYTSTAMCSPTRQQILTGLYPVRNGAYPNHSWVYPGTKSIAHYLQAAGYNTVAIGKRDFGNEASFPFQFLGGVDMDTKPKQRDIELEKCEKIVNGDKPYFLYVASNQPHVPWIRGNTAQYPPDKIKVPPHLLNTPATRNSLSKYYAEVTYLDSLVGVCLDMVERSPQKDNTIIIFTSEQGAQFPFSKWTCYDEGLKTAFIVKWPGVTKAGTRNSAFTQYVDVVPTLLQMAGVNPATISTGNKDANGNTGFDGKSFTNVLAGKTQTFRDYVFGVHTTHGIIKGTDNYPIRSVRNGKYLFIRNLNNKEAFTNVLSGSVLLQSWQKADPARASFYHNRPAIELYDVVNDPYQLHNLAANAKYKNLIAQFDVQLSSFMKQQGDKGRETEAMSAARQLKGGENQ